jgi:hypothetical protein
VKTFFDWMNDMLKDNFYSNTMVKRKLNNIIFEIKEGNVSPYQLGTELVHQYLKSIGVINDAHLKVF